MMAVCAGSAIDHIDYKFHLNYRMAQKDTLYDSIKQQREIDGRSYQRIMLAGYFNQEEIKRDSTNIEVYVDIVVCRLKSL